MKQVTMDKEELVISELQFETLDADEAPKPIEGDAMEFHSKKRVNEAAMS